MSTLKTTYLQHPSSGTANITLNSDGTVANTAGMGKVLQVESVYVSTNQTISTTSWVDLTSVTLTLTPASASSKFLVTYSGLLVPNNTTPVEFRMNRGGTGLGDSFYYESGSSKDSLQSYTYLDSPSTASAVTYKMEAKMTPSGGSMVFASSSFVVMEIAG